MSAPDLLLDGRGVRKEFGGLVAVERRRLPRCRAASIVSLIGPERRRQDDVLQHAHGRLHADRGRDHVRRQRDRRAAAAPDHRARHRPHVPEHPPLRHDDGARERAGRHALPHARGRLAQPSCARRVQRREERESREQARARCSPTCGLPKRGEHEYARNLAYGDQRRLEVARALATEPKLLLLDEPTAGMNPQETRAFTEFVRRVRDERSLTVLLIEHDMKVVMGVSERVTVLDHGEKIAEGTPTEIVRRTSACIEAYLGTEVDGARREPRAQPAPRRAARDRGHPRVLRRASTRSRASRSRSARARS